MKKIVVNSKYFWNVLGKDEDFCLAIRKDYIALYKNIPVYINNKYPDGINYE